MLPGSHTKQGMKAVAPPLYPPPLVCPQAPSAMRSTASEFLFICLFWFLLSHPLHIPKVSTSLSLQLIMPCSTKCQTQGHNVGLHTSVDIFQMYVEPFTWSKAGQGDPYATGGQKCWYMCTIAAERKLTNAHNPMNYVLCEWGLTFEVAGLEQP